VVSILKRAMRNGKRAGRAPAPKGRKGTASLISLFYGGKKDGNRRGW